jgi:GNAT superfamily N-acetyltransferase
MNIRQLTPEDYPTFAELRNLTLTEPISAKILRRRDELWDTEGFRQRLVAEVDGRVAGVATAHHWPRMQAGGFFGTLDVFPAFEGRGVGSRLLLELEAFVAECGGGRLVLGPRSDREASLSFLDRRGYTLSQVFVESLLDLHSAPPPPRAVDFEVASYAELGDSPAHRRQLFHLQQTTDANGPNAAFWGDGGQSFEEFEKQVFSGDEIDPRAMTIARDGAEWVALSMLDRVDDLRWGTYFTGVLPAYQGRGLGYETKRLALKEVRRQGARWVRAQNDAMNVPMITINRRLGFQPVVEWRFLGKQIEPRPPQV